MKLKLAEPARRDIEAIAEHWPGVFSQALHDALVLIHDNPFIGPAWPTTRHPEVRRLLLRRTEHHVCYRVDSMEGVVLMLRVWHARRGEQPGLSDE